MARVPLFAGEAPWAASLDPSRQRQLQESGLRADIEPDVRPGCPRIRVRWLTSAPSRWSLRRGALEAPEGGILYAVTVAGALHSRTPIHSGARADGWSVCSTVDTESVVRLDDNLCLVSAPFCRLRDLASGMRLYGATHPVVLATRPS